MDEIAYIQKELKDVSVEQLVTFLYGITMHTPISVRICDSGTAELGAKAFNMFSAVRGLH